MITAILASLAYALAASLPGLLFAAAVAYGRLDVAPTPWDDMLVAWYLVGLSTVASAGTFLAATALSGYWRGLTPRRAMRIAGGLGLITPVMTMVLTFATAALLLPLFRRTSMAAAVLFYALPGFVLGLAAPWIARARARLSG